MWSCHWFNSETVAGRINIPKEGRYLSLIDFPEWVNNNISDPYNATTVLDEVLTLFFPEAISPERYDYFLNELFLNFMNPNDWTSEWANYQNSGDATEVELILKNFFTEVLKGIEVQVI